MIAEDQGGGTQHQATELSECLSVCMLLTFSINLPPCRHHYCWYISHIYRFSIYLSNSLSHPKSRTLSLSVCHEYFLCLFLSDCLSLFYLPLYPYLNLEWANGVANGVIAHIMEIVTSVRRRKKVPSPIISSS